MAATKANRVTTRDTKAIDGYGTMRRTPTQRLYHHRP